MIKINRLFCCMLDFRMFSMYCFTGCHVISTSIDGENISRYGWSNPYKCQVSCSEVRLFYLIHSGPVWQNVLATYLPHRTVIVLPCILSRVLVQSLVLYSSIPLCVKLCRQWVWPIKVSCHFRVATFKGGWYRVVVMTKPRWLVVSATHLICSCCAVVKKSYRIIHICKAFYVPFLPSF